MQRNVMSERLNVLRTQLLGIFHDSVDNGIRVSFFSNSNRIQHISEMTILPLP